MIDGSNMLTSGDAQYILPYYTANTIAGTPTTWESLLEGIMHIEKQLPEQAGSCILYVLLIQTEIYGAAFDD